MKLKQLLLASGLLLAANTSAFAAEKFAVIMGNLPSANQFWALVEQGALEKGKELGVEVTALGSPGGESDIAGQIALVEDQLTQGHHRPCHRSGRSGSPQPDHREGARSGRESGLHRPARRRARHHLCRHRQ